MAETSDGAVELGRVPSAQPFDGAYGIADGDRRECESGEWADKHPHRV